MENNQSVSVSERVWSVAEQAGAERRQKFDKVMNRLFGLPEAAGKLAEIGGERVKAKAEELKQKAIDLKERTDQKITETKDKWTERFESARDNLLSRVEAFKTKVSDKATELENRAIKAGIETGLKIEDKIVAALELPAVISESVAGKLDEKIVSQENKLDTEMARQFAAEHRLDEKQRKALEKLLEKQRLQKEKLEGKHEGKLERKVDSLEGTENRKVESEKNALLIRAAVEKRRVFKGLADKIK